MGKTTKTTKAKTRKQPKARRVVITLEVETTAATDGIKARYRPGRQLWFAWGNALIRQCQVNVIRAKA